jgi:hypothetical protein
MTSWLGLASLLDLIRPVSRTATALLLAIAGLLAMTTGGIAADGGDHGAPIRQPTYAYDAPGATFKSIANPWAVAFHAYDAPGTFLGKSTVQPPRFLAPEAGAELPQFTQTTASSVFRNGPFAGRSIGDIAGGLRAGDISPSELPVDVISRGDNRLGLNTRSMLALRRAGISPSDWTMVDRTGQGAFEELLTQRLARNGLTDAGTDMLRITGAGPWASFLG